MIRKREIHIVVRQNNISIKGLWSNNSTIIPDDSPVEHLRNGNLYVFRRLFPTPFKCLKSVLKSVLKVS